MKVMRITRKNNRSGGFKLIFELDNITFETDWLDRDNRIELNELLYGVRIEVSLLAQVTKDQRGD